MWLTGGLTPDFKTEYTNVNGTLNAFTYSAGGATLTATSANNDYYNIAPEGALIYRPDSDWLIKARVGTGYGTPQASNLFVTPSGVAGNNTQLKSQTNLGYDLAVVWTPLETVKLSVDGFYEFFRNELISQSPGPSPLLTYTFNAPRSEGKGRLHLRQPNLYPIFGAAQRRDQNLRFQSRRPLASRYRPE
jgi:iron complex outermembrane receptor protein